MNYLEIQNLKLSEFNKIITINGKENILFKALEDISNLQVLIFNNFKKEQNIDNFKKKLADVLVSLKNIQLIFDIKDEELGFLMRINIEKNF